MKLNRKLEYSLMALRIMSEKRPGELTTAKEICDRCCCPVDATSKVLQVLARHQVLKSEQGPQGGYFIQKDLAKLSLYELTEMILGPLGVVKCLRSSMGCDIKQSCNIVAPMIALNSKLTDFYKKLGIQELIDFDPVKSSVLSQESTESSFCEVTS